MEVETIATAFSDDQFPKYGFSEFAFVGRSNVGKSSLLNTLINRKNVARISNTPGKTRTINFYLIDKKIALVDLPGYGFARISREMKNHWKRLMESYLISRENLELVTLLVDIRHKPTKDDLLMKQWLEELGINYIVAATKADKLSKNQRVKSMKIISNELNAIPIAFSSVTGEGKKEIWSKLISSRV